ncbi:LuxR C-terminal-related transcriptional regulator [Humibacillus xanthopallidus]|uniref:LuxR C-terminal-related transcriptional regulator n=1 Tax=Humibacillus xanthopallidus TaxID=412689 RepID=UPI0038516D4F
MIEVVVIAPVRAYREAMAAVVERASDMSVLSHVPSTTEALAAVSRRQPTAVLLDFSVGEVAEAVASLRRTAPSSRVIGMGINETRAHAEAVVRCAVAGASGFVDADQPLIDLLAAVRVSCVGQSPCSPRVAALLLQTMQRRPDTTWAGGPGHGGGMGASRPAASLTPRERTVAELASRGLTNRQIARQLFIGESTVKSHIHSVLTKLGLRGREDIVGRLVGGPAGDAGSTG